MRNDTLAAPDSHDMTITEMSHLHGVSLRTLRFYEQIGLIEPRRVGQQRFYAAKDSVRVQLILTGKRLGFSLRDVGEMLRSDRSETMLEQGGLVENLDIETIEQQISYLEGQRADIDAAISELKAMALE